MRKRNLLLTLVALSLATPSLWATPSVAEDGKLPGAFTVENLGGDNNYRKVYFSQGNLQYIGSASTPYWKFAEEQWECFLSTTSQGNAAANKDRDLFGWATSGWDNGNRVAYQPWATSQDDADYGVKNPKATDETLTGEYKNGDWGVYNSGDIGSGWRALTRSEAECILNQRPNYINLRTFATVHGKWGLILLPDGWTQGESSISTTLTLNKRDDFNQNISDEDWSILEAEGAVFLPTAGYRIGTTVSSKYGGGNYWCATSNDANVNEAIKLSFNTNNYLVVGVSDRYRGFAVRLVSDIPPLPAAVITSVPTAKTGLTYILSTPQTLINAGEAEGGAMLYSLDGTNWSEELPQGTNATTYTVYYKVQGDGVTHKDYTPSPNTFNVTISPADIVLPSFSTDLIYTGSPQPLLDITGIVGGTIYYSVDGNEPWLDVCPSETEIGTYDIWYKVVPDNSNYNAIPATKVTVTIDDPYPFVADNADPTTKLTELLNTPSDLKVKRIIYADDEYNTICLPFALDESALAASPLAGFNRLKTFKGAQVTGTAPDLYIDIFVEDATTIEAGIPYLITYPSAHADIVDPVFTGITVTTTEPSAVSVDGITFQGMFAQVHIDPYDAGYTQDYLFVGANSQLYWPLSTQTSSDIKMRGFRAYFIIDRNSISPAHAPKGTRARIMDAPKTTTAIDNLSAKFGGSEKIIENGILYIIRNGVKYNAQGQVIK